MKILLLTYIGMNLILFYTGCSENIKTNQNTNISDESIELLHSQIKSEKYEQIYQNSSETFKNCLNKYQFIEKMKNAVQQMKEVDSNLDFRIDKFGYEVAFDRKYDKDDYIKYWAVGSRDTQEVVEATVWNSSNELIRYSIMKNQKWLDIPDDSDCEKK